METYEGVYVAPESEHIFEPKDFDFIQTEKFNFGIIINYDKNRNLYEVHLHNGDIEMVHRSELELIMREQKQFIDAIR